VIRSTGGGLSITRPATLFRGAGVFITAPVELGAVPLVRAKGGVSGWADGRKGREFPDCYW